MRTIRYSLRLSVMLIAVGLLYLLICLLFRQAVQYTVLLVLLIATPGIERLWAVLDWMAPVVGSVDAGEQERSMRHIVEHEMARSMRYNSRLVVAALREERRTSLHVVEQYLRNSDLVLRGPEGTLLVLMPETTCEQARYAIQRLTSLLPIRDAVMIDEGVLSAIVKTLSTKEKEKDRVRTISPRLLRKVCIQLLEAHRISEARGSEPVIAQLRQPEALEWVQQLTNQRSSDDAVHMAA